MKKVSLSTQLLLLYTTVTILSAVVFGLITFRNYDSVYLSIAEAELNSYLVDLVGEGVKESADKPYLGYLEAELVFNEYEEMSFEEIKASNNVKNFSLEAKEYQEMLLDIYSNPGKLEYKSKKENFYLILKEVEEGENKFIIALMEGSYLNDLKGSIMTENVFLSFLGTFLAFATIMLVGNVILALWSREMTKRVQRLSDEVSSLSSFGYQRKIQISGNDEISELSERVEKMRLEIIANETTKQEMFQNLSHDFKTPIAVIRSYAEALEDGIIDKDDAKIIIAQTKKLQKKVDRLLEYNKLEYIASDAELEKVKMKDIITTVLEDYKLLLREFQLVISLDDSEFIGLKENYLTVVANIIDNATRYAKTKIVIKLKEEELSFYNDGEPIEEKYLTDLFKLYEKGTKGQFGLGMSIVQKTVNRFGYQLTVENVSGGVIFKIKKQQSFL